MEIKNNHESWEAFLGSESVKEELELLRSFFKKTKSYTPTKDNVFRIFQWDLDKIKVLNIGQDPYPQVEVATGRAFEVKIECLDSCLADCGGEICKGDSWDNTKINASLKNIVKLYYLYKTGNKKLIADIRKEIKNGEFIIDHPSILFDYWQMKGVYFMNKSLTTEIDKPGEHKAIWELFFNLLLNYIVRENKNIFFVLWGTGEINDRLKLLGVNEDKIIVMSHPSNRSLDILNNNIQQFEKIERHLESFIVTP